MAATKDVLARESPALRLGPVVTQQPHHGTGAGEVVLGGPEMKRPPQFLDLRDELHELLMGPVRAS